jgi:hypothetical protein
VLVIDGKNNNDVGIRQSVHGKNNNEDSEEHQKKLRRNT